VLARIALPLELHDASVVADVRGEVVVAQRAGSEVLASIAAEGFGAVPVRLRSSAGGEAAASLAGALAPACPARVVAPATIENGRYRVEAAEDGTFTLTDLASGYAIAGLGALEDRGDRGDEYDHDPVHEEIAWTSRSVIARRRVVARGPVVAELEVAFDAVLPARLSIDRTRRVGRARCRVRTVARLIAGVDRVEFTTTIRNTASDHRLRVVFPSPEARGPVRAEGHFAVLRRPARPRMPADPGSWVQLPQPTSHTTGFVAAGPLVVVTRGLPEYEAIEGWNGGLDIAVTLLRCVGWLARSDLVTRREDAGPALEVPDAQCLGLHTFEYAVTLDGAADDAALVRASADYRQPVRVGPGGADTARALEVDGNAGFAALKRSEDGAALVARIYAPGRAELPFTVRTGRPVRQVRLDESPAPDPSVPRAIRPGGIVSLRIELPPGATEA
jgi:hypothetical protein